MVSELEIEKDLIIRMDMPLYPLLPVVNRKDKKSGIIIAGDNVKLPLKVYVTSLFQIKGDKIETLAQLRETYQLLEFQTIEEFYNAGWRVD